MTAKQIYEKESGDVAMDSQIFYHEWSIRYTQWLEKKVEKQYNNEN